MGSRGKDQWLLLGGASPKAGFAEWVGFLSSPGNGAMQGEDTSCTPELRGRERRGAGVACVRGRAAGEETPFGSCQGPFRCHLCHVGGPGTPGRMPGTGYGRPGVCPFGWGQRGD